MTVIDAHLHLWARGNDGGAYSWLRTAPEALQRDFGPQEARAELDRAGVASAVLVQADDTVADTDYLLTVAAAHPWVHGVVGWLPLDVPGEAAAQLGRRLEQPGFCGVRHLVHDDPRDDFLGLPAVRRSLGLLAKAGLPFDVPDAYPRHLAATAQLAANLPELIVVIDHLAKPPLADREAYVHWERQLRGCAASANTVAKLSGLRIPGAPYDAAALRPVFETALELFGADRLMYGGDWPMSVPAGGP
jgi:L-fuconolactonase